MPMNTEVKALWLAALRSGEYAQTQGTLHRLGQNYDGRPAGYCCLGVLCDLAVKAGVTKELPYTSDRTSFGKDASDKESAFLPTSVQGWAGLENSNPEVIVSDEMVGYSLSFLNDSRHYTFAEIAEAVERSL
jgi:hypothetical protein